MGSLTGLQVFLYSFSGVVSPMRSGGPIPVNGHARRFVIEDAPTWQQCLTAILSDPAPDQGHSLLEQPVRPVGEDPIFPIFPIRIRREEDCHGNP